MRQRDLFEAACHAALARYKEDTAAGVWHVTRDSRFVDALLKAWERSLLAAARAHTEEVSRRREQAVQPLVQAVKRIKAGTG